MTYLEKAKDEHMDELKQATVTGKDYDIITLLCPTKYYNASEPCRRGLTYDVSKMDTKSCVACWNREI